ncbi:MAG: Bax inhibitor-1/YccA family protein [Phycisphaeraceae bacterium]
MASSNPAFRDRAMDRIRAQADDVLRSPSEPQESAPVRATGSMTITGSCLKTLSMFGLVMIAGSFTWDMAMSGSPNAQAWLFGGAIGGLIVGILTCFKPNLAPITAPIYAVLQGLFLGGISAMYNAQFQGIVLQAVMLTMAVACAMAALYAFRIIRVTTMVRGIIVSATLAVMLVYLASFVLGMFGAGIPFLHDTGPLGIGISLVIVGIAAFNLLLDFDFIEKGSAQGLPKWAEWYAAFGLMVTLIWLYLEVLRLLSKLRSR